MANGDIKSSWGKHAGIIITVVILLAGIIGSWYSNKATVNELQRTQAKIEQRLEKIEQKSHELELKAVVDSSVLNSLKEVVLEIKQDVKTLLDKK